MILVGFNYLFYFNPSETYMHKSNWIISPIFWGEPLNILKSVDFILISAYDLLYTPLFSSNPSCKPISLNICRGFPDHYGHHFFGWPLRIICNRGSDPFSWTTPKTHGVKNRGTKQTGNLTKNKTPKTPFERPREQLDVLETFQVFNKYVFHNNYY